MLYHLVRPVARFTLARFYRTIDLTGLQHIPRDAPVILAANHPTAFIEPCLMACFQNRPLHFLARGDFFRNGLAAVLLRALHILPVYRMQDGGYEQLTRNYDTFEACYRALSKSRALMILAEGRCIHEKRLRPLRKGTARIALGALDRDNTLGEVYIVPVGVNYSAPERVRSTVMIRCGEPLRTSAYLAGYRANEAAGLRELTEDLHAALSPLVVQLPEPDTDDAYQTLLEVHRNGAGTAEYGVTHHGKLLDAELAAMSSGRTDVGAARRYASELYTQRLTDQALLGGSDRPSWWRMLVAALLLLPQLPLWVLAEGIALTGPKRIEFYSPLRFATVAVGQLLYLPLLFVLPGWAVAWVVASTFTQGWALCTWEEGMHRRERARFRKLPIDVRDRLRRARAELI
ncbi:1-acyl-sn-glycerol-3-phosphate acyltransferase [Lewinella sp. IMCC34183]|uniref:1-acyl-sn-glycerol-3-phosphate acyltransferase n=1 Tax=Lewinella sp. IMCC34183 TaxID=2248762 RepID=UPI000E289C4E|nr:1-acyl-sn-glycerol-3-phosphate acyltransferase [Lewinella sp. IMCC34183]